MSAKAIKARLLKPAIRPATELNLFGDRYLVRRLSAARLAHFDSARRQAEADGNNANALNQATAALLLDSIVDENGAPLSNDVDPAELLESYDPAELGAALTTVLQHNFLSESGAAIAKNG